MLRQRAARPKAAGRRPGSRGIVPAGTTHCTGTIGQRLPAQASTSPTAWSIRRWTLVIQWSCDRTQTAGSGCTGTRPRRPAHHHEHEHEGRLLDAAVDGKFGVGQCVETVTTARRITATVSAAQMTALVGGQTGGSLQIALVRLAAGLGTSASTSAAAFTAGHGLRLHQPVTPSGRAVHRRRGLFFPSTISLLSDRMRVRVLYFAVVRERIGRDEEELELAGGRDRRGGVARARAAASGARRRCGGSIKLAVNEEFAAAIACWPTAMSIALIPPVAGGAGAVLSRQRRAAVARRGRARGQRARAGRRRDVHRRGAPAEPRQADRAARVRGVSADGRAQAGGDRRAARGRAAGGARRDRASRGQARGRRGRRWSSRRRRRIGRRRSTRVARRSIGSRSRCRSGRRRSPRTARSGSGSVREMPDARHASRE